MGNCVMHLVTFLQYSTLDPSLEDDPRIGRPVTCVTDANIEAVRALIEENPHISIRYIAFELGVSYGTISSIIHDQIKKVMCTMDPT